MKQSTMRNLGRFRVSRLYFVDGVPEELAYIFKDMVVIRAQENMELDCIEYIAVHPSFSDVKMGCLIPMYHCEFTRGSAVVRWVLDA